MTSTFFCSLFVCLFLFFTLDGKFDRLKFWEYEKKKKKRKEEESLEVQNKLNKSVVIMLKIEMK